MDRGPGRWQNRPDTRSPITTPPSDLSPGNREGFLSRSTVEKSVALLALITILDGGYAVFAHTLYARIEAFPYLDPAGWSQLVWFLDWVTALNMGALVLAYLMRARGIEHSRFLPHLVMQLVMVPLGIGAHFQGPFSSVFWTAVFGAATVGLLIFDALPTLLATASFVALITWSTWSAYTGANPYTPVFAGPPMVDGHVAGFYLARMWISTVGLSAVPLGLAYYLITRMHERERLLSSLSYTDALTATANRRAFLEALETELSRCARHGHPLSLAILDLDHFKQVNDRHGHLAGDRALRVVGRALLEVVRSPDLVGRYGGEEFAILLPETDDEGARAAAERCRQAVETLAVDVDDGPAITLTASVGHASYPGPDVATFEDLIRAADAALYRAKASGRDRVVGHGEPG